MVEGGKVGIIHALDVGNEGGEDDVDHLDGLLGVWGSWLGWFGKGMLQPERARDPMTESWMRALLYVGTPNVRSEANQQKHEGDWTVPPSGLPWRRSKFSCRLFGVAATQRRHSDYRLTTCGITVPVHHDPGLDEPGELRGPCRGTGHAPILALFPLVDALHPRVGC